MDTALKMSKLSLVLFAFLGLFISFSTFAATLTSQVDRSVVGEDETLQLTVRLDEQINFGGPDFDLLKQNFEILDQQRFNQFRSVNGKTDAWTEWNMTLMPKSAGQLLVPSFKYKDAYSQAIEVTVNKSSQVTNGDVPDIVIETSVDKTEAHVQEQILLTFSVHSALNIREIGQDELKIEDVVIEKVAENEFQRQIKGRSYRTREYVYALYPQKSGEIIVPKVNWALAIASNGYGWSNG